jgi:hypothetical protein
MLTSGFAVLTSLLAFACGGADAGGSLGGRGGSGSDDENGGSFGSGGAAGKEDELNACAGTVATTAAPKADIIFVIDNSGSMGEEMAGIQANVNRFAERIGQSGLDYRVVFIVSKEAPAGTKDHTLAICVPQPLAGPGCSDNPGKFYHVSQNVQSRDSLSLILATYDGSPLEIGDNTKYPSSNVTAGPWNKYVRADATKIFVEVTDDESGMQAEEFDRLLLAKAPAGMFGTPTHRNYVFHSIVSKPSSAPVPSTAICSTAAGTSIQYQNLSTMTGGLIEEVCKSDYSAVLDNIASGITERLACELAYPKAETSDPSKLVVRYTAAGAPSATLTQVTDPSKCNQVDDGWYYDDPKAPTRIMLCPSACKTANDSAGAKLEALVGCTAPAPR